MNDKYKIGLYIRLSRDDGDDEISESIINQRSLLNNYLKLHNLVKTEEYIDDGFSGTNFDRPAFIRLKRDMELGKINCIITKDLSRLGRDHIETGYYIEKYFPLKGIRYIAINDDIDTFNETSSSDMLAFRLSMNDMYAKDISKKVRSHLLIMKKEGKFCGSTPPFGYVKDPDNKHKLIIDSNTSFIVKEIFDLYVSGYSSITIAEILTQKNYPTPIMFKNIDKKQDKCNHPEIWKHSSVNNILKNKVYTGCLIQHTTEKINYKTKKRKKINKSDWCIKENTHEAIIDIDTFNLAQSIRSNHNTYSNTRRNVIYNLSGMVYCKDCGAKMTISYDRKRNRISMNCNNYRKFSKYHICSSHYINYTRLEKIIIEKIRTLSKNYFSCINEFKNIIDKNSISNKTILEDKFKKLKEDINVLYKKQDSLYDDKFNNIISIDIYKRLSDNFTRDIINLKKEKEKIEKELFSVDKSDKELNNLIIEKYLNIENPIKEMFFRIIDKIYIDKDKNISIYYKIQNN